MFFELSGSTNSTIGSYQIDYVNFRPNRATEWHSTPKRCSRASSLDAPLLGEADGAVAYHSENFQSAASPDAAAIGGTREGMPSQSRILRIASGGYVFSLVMLSSMDSPLIWLGFFCYLRN